MIPFFIIGSGRSGSTFLYHLLSAHPKIALTNEAKITDLLCFFYEYSQLPAGQPNPTRAERGIISPVAIPVFSDVFQQHAQQMLVEFYQHSFPDKSFSHWGDKLPDAACAIALAEFLPETRYLVVMRDPRDTVSSYRSYGLRMGGEMADHVSQPIEVLAQSWVRTYDHIFKTLAPEQVSLVQYETLIADPMQTANRALKFLSLPPSDQVKKAWRTNQSFPEHGTSHSPQASIGRWRQDLSPVDLDQVSSICAEYLQRYYPQNVA
jgi:hypothetical protein